jgi:Holliday junction resolvase
MTSDATNPASGWARTGSGKHHKRLASNFSDNRLSAQEYQAHGSDHAVRGGRKSRQKGDRFERAIVRLLQDAGFGAERVPLSGSAGGSYLGDLTVPILGRDLVVEAKSRASGFSRLYSWLQDRDLLIIKADRRDALVVLPLKLAAEIAIAAERGKP